MTTTRKPVAVLVWVRYPAVVSKIDARAIAWTPRAVTVEWIRRPARCTPRGCGRPRSTGSDAQLSSRAPALERKKPRLWGSGGPSRPVYLADKLAG